MTRIFAATPQSARFYDAIIIIGPRQVGKTTAAQQIAEKWPGRVLTFSADSPVPPGPEWIQGNWERAVRVAESGRGAGDVLLVIDEIQKVRGWSEIVKLLWDEELFFRSRPVTDW